MDLMKLMRAIDAETARAFVVAGRHVIDAMLIEAARVEQARTPRVRDYASAALPREAPPGGWLSHDELRRTAQQLGEAIAAEKWVEGVTCTIRCLAHLGVVG